MSGVVVSIASCEYIASCVPSSDDFSGDESHIRDILNYFDTRAGDVWAKLHCFLQIVSPLGDASCFT